MGGAIGVDSTESVGSTFWFTAVLRRQAFAPADRFLDFSPHPVLVAGAGAAIREWLSVLLDSWKCPHVAVASATEALARLRTAAAEGRPFHAAIVDACLPDGGSRELASIIERERDMQDVRLVLLTPLHRYGDALRSGTPGFATCVSKPVKRDSLGQGLAGVLGLETAREAGSDRIAAFRAPTGAGRKVMVVDDNPTNRR